MSSKPSELEQSLLQFRQQEAGPYRAWDPVNRPMIRHWCEVMGDGNPVYTDPASAERAGFDGVIAPPAMMQAWVMPGYGGSSAPGSSAQNPFAILNALEEAGYPAIVAVNCEQEYFQYLQEGDEVYFTAFIEEVSKEKKTALGAGFFITQLSRFYRGEKELVGEMRFRVFKYRPHEQPAAAAAGSTASAGRFRPARGGDAEFFWQGVEKGQLLIQRCTSCGALRHPPAPMCPSCQSLEWDTMQSCGRGRLYSYTVFHHPPIPPFEYPNSIALVELEEGTRIVSQLTQLRRDEIRIGMALEAVFEEVEQGLTLPLFRAAGGAR